MRYSNPMSLHIGIVACSAEGAALCYRTICDEAPAFMGRHMHPEVSMHTFPLGEYMSLINAADWKGVAALMLASARKLQSIGADFLLTPDNTIHHAMPYVLPDSPLPWLHIVEEVAAEAQRRGFKKLAITGTRVTMEGTVYPDVLKKAGIDHRAPTPLDREKIDKIIFDELVNGIFRSESLGVFRAIIERLKSEGCDAVVLGCTEIPLLVTPETSPLPVLDSTRLLARAAIHRALGQPATAR
ncbi:MAG TPA: amino acid racemase [Terriglobales bacterium]|nr:amino acid racemase [Terriglobales bacterium]